MLRTLGSFGQGLENLQTVRAVGDCLRVGGVRIGAMAGLEPVRQCLLHEASFRVVPREDFGGGRYHRGSLLLDHRRDLGMQLVPLTP